MHILVVTLVILLLPAVQSLPLPPELQSHVLSIIEDSEFEKHPHDHRTFAHLELKNGARALVVSDRDVIDAELAVTFNVGVGMDPRDIAGLVELMSYCAAYGADGKRISPEGTEFGGISTRSSTTYRMRTGDSTRLAEVLPSILESLAHPTYTTQTVATQSKLVFQNARLLNDTNPYPKRLLSAYLDHHIAVRKLSPSLDVPLPELHQRVKEFQSRYFTADHLTLLMTGREPVEELAALAVKELSKFKKGAVEDAVDFEEMLMTMKWIPKEKLGKQIYFASNDDQSEVTSFIFPIFHAKLQFNGALTFLADVLSQTRARAVGFPDIVPGQGFLNLVAAGDPTEIKQIGDQLFSTIHFLRQQEPPMWWVEGRAEAYANYSRAKRQNFTIGHSLLLRKLDVRQSPKGHGLATKFQFNAEEWREFLDIFKVDSVLVSFRGERFKEKCDRKVDGDAGSYWGVEELNPEWKKSWQRHLDGEEKIPDYDELVMPPRDNFISTSSEVKALDPSSASDVPIKVPLADPAMSDKLDLYWWQPQDRRSVQVFFVVRITFPHLYGKTAFDFNMASTFCEAYNAVFRRLAKGAPWDENSISLLLHPEGSVTLKIQAQADVMPKFLRTALLFMSALRVTTADMHGLDPDVKVVESMVELYNVQFLPAPDLREYFQGLVDGTVTPPAPPKIFSHAHVQMVAGGNLLKAEAQQFASDVVNTLGIKEGFLPDFSRHIAPPRMSPYDEDGKPRRLKVPVAHSEGGGETGNVRIAWSSESVEEPAALADLIRNYIDKEITLTCSKEEGCEESSITYRRQGQADSEMLWFSFEGEKVIEHLPQLLEQVMADLDAHTDEKWFDKRKEALLERYRRLYTQEVTATKAERFFEQLRSRRPFAAMTEAEAGLRALTFDRFKELIRSYNDRAWVIDVLAPERHDIDAVQHHVVSPRLAPIKQVR